MTDDFPDLSAEMKRILHASWEQDEPGVILGEDGPRFRRELIPYPPSTYAGPEPIPDIHYRWLEEHTCQYCPDTETDQNA